MKDNITKECYQRIRKFLKGSINSRNTIQAINARAVSIIRSLCKKQRSLHPRVDLDRLCWKRKNGGKGLTSVE